MADRIQIRRDTAVKWTGINPILANGEIGYENDTAKLKFGDGVTAWNVLAYLETGGGLENVVEDLTPQLGGDLDGQGFAITNVSLPFTINAQTGTAYTAVLTDASKMITLDNAASIAMTIPSNASVPYPIGTVLSFEQLGAGVVTVGITDDTLSINAGATAVMDGQYSVATALKITSTEWVLFGQLVAFGVVGGANELSDLTDVNTSTPTNRFVLVADGADFESRLLVEADISDLGNYLTSVAISDMDNGTDGELLTWSSSGVATTVSVGISGRVLTSNGFGQAPTFQAAASGGLNNIVEDSTPQLGGTLDLNGNDIVTIDQATADDINITAGDSSSGNGADVFVTAGNGPANSGSAGKIQIRAGRGYYGGGNLDLYAGDAFGTYPGGNVRIAAGKGDNNQQDGDGGNVLIYGGRTAAGPGDLAEGGDVFILGGANTGGGHAGHVILQGGGGQSNTKDGHVVLQVVNRTSLSLGVGNAGANVLEGSIIFVFNASVLPIFVLCYVDRNNTWMRSDTNTTLT